MNDRPEPGASESATAAFFDPDARNFVEPF